MGTRDRNRVAGLTMGALLRWSGCGERSATTGTDAAVDLAPNDHDVQAVSEPAGMPGPGHALLAITALALLVAPEPACLGHSCSEVGCQDQFSVVLQAATASLPEGTHRIDVMADGTALSCTFEFPSEAQPGVTTLAQCSPGLLLFVGPAQKCTEISNADIRGLQCVPIPEQTQEALQIPGTPSQVSITQTVNGTIILQTQATPIYKASRPNGPDCEPLCHQATLTLMIP